MYVPVIFIATTMENGHSCLDEQHSHDTQEQPVRCILFNLSDPPYQKTRMKPKHEAAEKRSNVRKNSFHPHRRKVLYSTPPNQSLQYFALFNSTEETLNTLRIQPRSLFCNHDCNAKFLSYQAKHAYARKKTIDHELCKHIRKHTSLFNA